MAHYCVEPDLILYLRTPADVCMARIKERDRVEEVGIPLEYLQQLEGLHDEWLMDNPDAILLDGKRRWTTDELLSIVDTHLRNR